MDSKKMIITRAKSLSIILSFFVLGLFQTAKAQYNLQLDSVITASLSSNTASSLNKTFEVPPGKVWKVQSAYCQGGDIGSSNFGYISLIISDQNGNDFNVGAINAKLSEEDFGTVWLSAGCKIIFEVTARTSSSYSARQVKGFLSALQFSTQ